MFIAYDAMNLSNRQVRSDRSLLTWRCVLTKRFNKHCIVSELRYTVTPRLMPTT